MSDREVELVYLDQIRRILSSLRIEVSKLHTEVRDLRAERKPEPTVERIHYPPPAPRPEDKKWWGAPWKTSLG